MLWLVLEGASYQMRECNTHYRDGKYQLWIERNNGKSLKVIESEYEQEIKEVKEAIDYAVRTGQRSLELN